MNKFDKALDEILLKHGAEQGELHYSLKEAIKQAVEECIIGGTKRVKPVNEVRDEYDLIENHHKVIAVNERIYEQRQALRGDES